MGIISPIPLRNQFLNDDGTVTWAWVKWFLELQGVAPFDPNNLFALTIEESQAVDAAEQAASDVQLASLSDAPPVDAAMAEEIASGVALMLSDPSSAGSSKALVEPITLVIDGGGAVPATGDKGFGLVLYDRVITGWTLLSDLVGDCQITVNAGAYASYPTVSSIVAAAPPKLVGAQSAQSTAVGTWTTLLPANTVIQFNLDSVATCTRIVLVLETVRL